MNNERKGVTELDGEIRVETEGPIAKVVISRPDKLNSVTRGMLIAFEDTISKLANDRGTVAIVVTGDGDKAFSAGFDLEMMKSLKGEAHYDFFKILERTISVLRQTRNCVTVAAVNGYAVGFGAMVACACDFRLFSDNAAIRFPELDLSVFPASGAASNLIHLVGPSRTKDLLLTGRTVTAEEALRIGIADRVVRLRELMPTVMEFLSLVLKKDHKLIMRTKTLIDGMTGEELVEAADLEGVYLEEWLRECKENPDK